MMGGHLGTRVSDLLDGRLSVEDEERAWEHVHGCHLCRDQVEREGWVKTRLAGLSLACDVAPAALKGSLLDPRFLLPPGESYLAASSRPRARTALAAAGGGALGAAVIGLVAFVGAPASAPTVDLRTPTVTTGGTSPAPPVVDPVRRDGARSLRPSDTMAW